MYSREGRINHRLTALDVFLAALAGNVEQKMLMVCTPVTFPGICCNTTLIQLFF